MFTWKLQCEILCVYTLRDIFIKDQSSFAVTSADHLTEGVIKQLNEVSGDYKVD